MVTHIRALNVIRGKDEPGFEPMTFESKAVAPPTALKLSKRTFSMSNRS